MRQDDVVGRAPIRRLVALMTNVAGPYPELAQSPGDSPWEELIEEQPDVGWPRRGATS